MSQERGKSFKFQSQSTVDVLVAASRHDRKIAGPVFVQVALTEPAVQDRQHHPIILPLPHKFRRKEDQVNCLVVKDPSGPLCTELTKYPDINVLFDEVIGVGKLRRRIAHGKKNGRTTKQAEKFGQEFSHIFVDLKVIEPLQETLGLGFYKRSRNLPIPIRVDDKALGDESKRKHLKINVKLAAQSAQLILKPDSKLVSARVGHIQMDATKLAANVDAFVKLCKERIPSGLGGLAIFYLKTADSLALKIEEASEA